MNEVLNSHQKSTCKHSLYWSFLSFFLCSIYTLWICFIAWSYVSQDINYRFWILIKDWHAKILLFLHLCFLFDQIPKFCAKFWFSYNRRIKHLVTWNFGFDLGYFATRIGNWNILSQSMVVWDELSHKEQYLFMYRDWEKEINYLLICFYCI